MKLITQLGPFGQDQVAAGQARRLFALCGRGAGAAPARPSSCAPCRYCLQQSLAKHVPVIFPTHHHQQKHDGSMAANSAGAVKMLPDGGHNQ